MQVNFQINIDDRIIRFFKRTFAKRNSIIITICVIFFAGVLAVMAQSLEWTDFQPGDPVSSSAINTRFDALRDHAVPTGTIIAFAGTFDTVPDGWLVCNGQAVSRNDYNELFTVLNPGIGSGQSRWGTGDGSTTFNVPDLRGCFLRGVDGDPVVGERGYDPDTNRTGDEALSAGTDEEDAFQDFQIGGKRSGVTYYGAVLSTNDYLTWSSSSGYANVQFYSIGWQGLGVGIYPLDDGTHGEPRTSYETRPKNYAVIYIIKD